jgi:phage-related minor tail protein
MTRSTSTLGTASSSLDSLNQAAGSFGTAISDAFAKGAAQGKSFDQVVQSVGAKLLDLAAKSAVPDLGAMFSGASQNVFSSVMPFADGGVIAAPSYFPTGGGNALVGEAGPEAIMPLSRGADGKLGLAGQGGSTVHVTINAQDAESFKRSEAQVAAALARAVQRGRRAM